MPPISHNTRKQIQALVTLIQKELQGYANPSKAQQMQAYMKTDMPFYGVQKPQRLVIEKQIKQEFRVNSHSKYVQTAQALWELPHREEKYLTIAYCRMHSDFITFDSILLYESMIRADFAWWDLVDEVAINLIGVVVKKNPHQTERKLREWITDNNMWIRRTAILAQLKLKEVTNESLLYELCKQCMEQDGLFIQKAIGWALREYSKTNPASVKAFIEKERNNMSGLTFREATKSLKARGLY